jgi:hypothetical protein
MHMIAASFVGSAKSGAAELRYVVLYIWRLLLEAGEIRFYALAINGS